LKLVGIKEFYNITRAKMVSAVNCCIVVSLCATATFAVDSAIDYTTVQAQPIETEVTITIVSYPEGYDPESSSSSEPAVTSETPSEPADTSATTSTEASTSEGSTESSEPTTSSSGTSESATESTAASTTKETTKETTKATTKETTKATTKETTKETKQEITESELYITVYATTTVNVRKGPGTDYAKVKNVFQGDAIDVVAVTSNGWYKTYNGNYVKKSLTSESKPKNTNTPTPKPKPKATNTSAPKPKATNTTKPKATATAAPKPSGESVKCKITFYGPQKLKDGTYSKSTASGTTCTEGRTVAADWSIFPKGTKIYIENDPLGGDGYYTVEDKGGAVKGYIIDIYAEDGESGNHKTCYRNVSVVKK
jgi:3D (Asp-Asp-Asp) domain-containing protein